MSLQQNLCVSKLCEWEPVPTKKLVGIQQYDALLGMPWHVRSSPPFDYVKRTVRVNISQKSIEASRKTREKCPLLKREM